MTVFPICNRLVLFYFAWPSPKLNHNPWIRGLISRDALYLFSNILQVGANRLNCRGKPSRHESNSDEEADWILWWIFLNLLSECSHGFFPPSGFPSIESLTTAVRVKTWKGLLRKGNSIDGKNLLMAGAAVERGKNLFSISVITIIIIY